MVFKASMDKTARTITGIAVGLLCVTFIAITGFYRHAEISLFNAFYTLFLVLLLTVGICFFLRPLYYVLTDTEFLIRRPLSAVHISCSSIRRVLQPPDDEMQGVVRTFGVGGLFGYFGKFFNSAQGQMTWYATQRTNYVMIVTDKDKKILLTPDDPGEFIRQAASFC